MICINCNEEILEPCGKSGKFCSRKCASKFAAKQPRKSPSNETKEKRAFAIKEGCKKFIGVRENCLFCNKEYSVKGMPSHIWRSHGEGINHNPNLKLPFQNGRVIWNKGLTNETSAIVAKISKSVSKTAQLKIKNGTYISHPMSLENRKKLSIAQSLHNRGGICKWFKVAEQKVQGTW